MKPPSTSQREEAAANEGPVVVRRIGRLTRPAVRRIGRLLRLPPDSGDQRSGTARNVRQEGGDQR